MPRAVAIALSHGGGPLPVLGDPRHAAITASLRTRVPALLRLGTPDAPRAVVVVTAHWSADRPTVSGGARHPLLFDYYNFPAEAYRLKYDAPGAPEVAREVFAAFEKAGLKPEMDEERGTF
jgi:aromatic ring-opening dioxygenase catalytic subunit (LigB family)